MKSIDEILFAISCKEGQCGDCAYYYDEDCSESIKKDAEKLIHSLLDENKALHTEIIASHGGYWGNICESPISGYEPNKTIDNIVPFI